MFTVAVPRGRERHGRGGIKKNTVHYWGRGGKSQDLDHPSLHDSVFYFFVSLSFLSSWFFRVLTHNCFQIILKYWNETPLLLLWKIKNALCVVRWVHFMIKSNYIYKFLANYLRLILTAESNSDERRGLMFLFSVHYIENKLHSIFAAHDVHKDIRWKKTRKIKQIFWF